MRISANIIICFLIFIAPNGSAQDIDFKFIDSLSYKLYINADWKELKKISRSGFKNDIDYYYLRMRSGIAYYETGNYITAIKHFKKAIAFNELDTYPSEYLFYSYLFTGNPDQAKYSWLNSGKLTPDIPNAKLRKISSFALNTAYMTNTDNKPERKIIPSSGIIDDGYQTISRSFLYNSILLKHDISRFMYLTHSFGLLVKNNYYLNSYQGTLSESLNNNINQYQYYASVKFIPVNDLFINAGIHYINYSSPNIIYRELNSGIQYIVPGFSRSNFAGDLSVFASFWLLNAGGGISYGNLNNGTQFQQNFTLSFYPLGNTDLYFVSRLNLIDEMLNDSSRESHLLQRYTAGLKLLDKLWIEGTIWSGEFRNAILNEAYLIYNANEMLSSRYDVNFILPFKKIYMSFLISKSAYFSSLYTITGTDTGTNKTKLNSINSLISLKWNL